MKLIFIVLLICSCSHHHKHHRFNDVRKWEKIFEDKNRDSWQKPDEVINSLNIKKDSVIADIGAATGYFPVRLAKKVSAGRVWAIDIEPELVNFLNSRAEKEGITNLFSTLGTEDDPLIAERVDFIFIVNTYHHISNRVKYFVGLKNKLRPGGSIVIIDFKKKELPFGPKMAMKISKQQIIKELSNSGFYLKKSIPILEYQNILVFRK